MSEDRSGQRRRSSGATADGPAEQERAGAPAQSAPPLGGREDGTLRVRSETNARPTAFNDNRQSRLRKRHGNPGRSAHRPGRMPVRQSRRCSTTAGPAASTAAPRLAPPRRRRLVAASPAARRGAVRPSRRRRARPADPRASATAARRPVARDSPADPTRSTPRSRTRSSRHPRAQPKRRSSRRSSTRPGIDEAHRRRVRQGQPARRSSRRTSGCMTALGAPAGRTRRWRTSTLELLGSQVAGLYAPTTRSCSSSRRAGGVGPVEKVDVRARVHPRAPGPELRPRQRCSSTRSTRATGRSPAWRSSRATRRRR